jgi:hypothetical protein
MSQGRRSAAKLLTKDEARRIAQYWALGFLSGVNISGSAGTDFLEPIDGQAVWAWLDNYCRDHPLDEFPGAIKALVRELVARRAQHK